MHIAVAGNIGSGKTTLTKMLAQHYGWTPKYEDVENNPYISDFYADMMRWSFNLQVYFLQSRFAGILEILKSEQTIIQDRTIYEDSWIFASNLHSMNLMSTRDYNTYSSMFEMMMTLVPYPDLLIYLRSSVPTLVNHIQKRGRPYESSIRLDYLNGLNEKYESWIKSYEGKLLIIETDVLQFETNPKDFGEVIDKIDAQLHGLF